MKTPFHVTPINDLKEHYNSSRCWCEPTIECEGNLIVHHAADGREFFEDEEREATMQGLREAAMGKVTPLEQIRRELKGN